MIKLHSKNESKLWKGVAVGREISKNEFRVKSAVRTKLFSTGDRRSTN